MTQPFRPFVPSPAAVPPPAAGGQDPAEAADVPPTLPLTVEAPPEVEVGVYANTASTWFTETDVAVDFAVVLPSELVDTDDGEAVLPRARLVSRVRMPPTQARELVDALTEALVRYEGQFGALPRRADGPSDLWTV